MTKTIEITTNRETSDPILQKFQNHYTKTLDQNAASLPRLLESIHLSEPVNPYLIQQITMASAQNLTDKWLTGRKSLRTEIAYRTIPDYPESMLTSSLLIDALINLLDDSLDELMTKPERSLYIIELVRVLAIYNHQTLSKEAYQKIAEYFNKILCIAATEKLYAKNIKSTTEFSRCLQQAINCYNCKSIVIDIFFELPLLERYGAKTDICNIISLARVHRALYQILKDYNDVERDIANETETPMVILFQKEEKIKDYIDAMIDYYLWETENLLEKNYETELREISVNLTTIVYDKSRHIRKILL
ncbi:MAG: hypothetical protein KKC68_07770 [Candidatus Thermoplasmatota archaeon]|nr:hypothetical protein [Candidatus Thermoplasmatota archaeon]MBU1941655.1 hypothetical protein [Candidatus Thermoplasmatota archaeon]